MYVVIDLETTGFDKMNDDIIQFSYVAFDAQLNFVRAETMYYYYKGMSWSEDAYKVHKIPLSELEKHADEFKQNLIKMYAILNNNFIIGYNSQHFDGPFAQAWLMRMGIIGLNFSNHMDMMIEFKPVYKKARMSLVNLCNMLGFTPEKIRAQANAWLSDGQDSKELHAHDAYYDTVATAMLLIEAVSRGLIGYAGETGEVAVHEDVSTGDLFAAGLPLDPRGIVVFLTNYDDSRVVNAHFISHDENKYAQVKMLQGTMMANRIKNGFVIPLVMHPDDEDKTLYSAYFEGIKYRCNVHEVEIYTPMSVVSTKTFEPQALFKRQFAGFNGYMERLVDEYEGLELVDKVIEHVQRCECTYR